MGQRDGSGQAGQPKRIKKGIVGKLTEGKLCEAGKARQGTSFSFLEFVDLHPHLHTTAYLVVVFVAVSTEKKTQDK